MIHDNRWCLVCQARHRTLYWHENSDEQIEKNIIKYKSADRYWCYCNKCDKAYSLSRYCELANIDMEDFLAGDMYITESKPNEVNALAWPHNFIPLSDPRASKGVDYIKSRGLDIDGDMYYDLDEEGIVFPYYFNNQFCGAQIRFITPKLNEEGKEHKITTMPKTRLGLLFYGWNQSKLMANIKGIVVTEGAFNAIALQQSLNKVYGGVSRCPWKVVACSGAGLSDHQSNSLKNLKDSGIKIYGAPDTDEAGLKMLNKMIKAECISGYALTNDTEKDWNDLLKSSSKSDLASFFIKSIKLLDE